MKGRTDNEQLVLDAISDFNVYGTGQELIKMKIRLQTLLSEIWLIISGVEVA